MTILRRNMAQLLRSSSWFLARRSCDIDLPFRYSIQVAADGAAQKRLKGARGLCLDLRSNYGSILGLYDC